MIEGDRTVARGRKTGILRVHRNGEMVEIPVDARTPADKTEIAELPRWAKLALADRLMYGWTHERAAKRYNKSKFTLERYACCPAGKKWQDELRKHLDDPEAMASALLRGTIVGVAKGYLWAYEAAKESGDYREVGTMSRDMLDRFGVRKGGAKEGKKGSIVINLGKLTLEAPKVESFFKEVMPHEIEDDDAG